MEHTRTQPLNLRSPGTRDSDPGERAVGLPTNDHHQRLVPDLRLLPFFILLALMMIWTLSEGAEATKTGDIYSGSGDWFITNETIYRNESVVVDGNIFIHHSGSLVFDNSTIDFTNTVGNTLITIENTTQFINANISENDHKEREQK